jgi:hypothetical protein
MKSEDFRGRFSWPWLIAKKLDMPPAVSDGRCVRFALRQLKKRAGVSLTSPTRLRHNPSLRKYVHGERVLAQPTTSERRFPVSFCSVSLRDHRRYGIDAIRGLSRPRVAFSVCLPKSKSG